MRGFSSLKYRISVFISTGVIIIACVIMAYTAYILKIKDDRISHSLESSLALYCKETSTSLNNVESFLLTKCFVEEDIHKISQPREEIDRYLAMIDMKAEFQDSIDNYNMLDGLFLYDSAHDVFLAQCLDGENALIRNHVDSFIDGFQTMCNEGVNGWFSVMVDDEYYLAKMFELHDVYVSSFVKVSTIIGSLSEIVLGESDFVVLCNREGRILDRRLQNVSFQLQNQKNVRIKGISYRNLQVSSKNNDFSFAILQEKGGIFRGREIVWTQFALSILGVIIISLGSALLMQRFFSIPINELIQAMKQLKEGKLEVNLEKENVFDEFKIVNETFEEMVREIKKLKIDVYEEMINKQRVELLYLQEQTNPHFLTNCMNLIRNLSLLGENEKIENASILLSNYMRYSLGTSTLISIEREIEHVRTYENLQRMRFGEHLIVTIEVEAAFVKQLVPTMLIQTFVDNAVKHQMDQESELLISVIIKEIRSLEGEKNIEICIKDNGEGFSDNILCLIQQNKKIVDSTGEHIGIYNVCQRLEILYHARASIEFFNAKEGGAVVLVKLPDDNEDFDGK
ncbi:MAG: sensor histidine kinase [Velocimicrobium sp.]